MHMKLSIQPERNILVLQNRQKKMEMKGYIHKTLLEKKPVKGRRPCNSEITELSPEHGRPWFGSLLSPFFYLKMFIHTTSQKVFLGNTIAFISYYKNNYTNKISNSYWVRHLDSDGLGCHLNHCMSGFQMMVKE